MSPAVVARVMPTRRPERFASTSTERFPFHQSSASSPWPPGGAAAASLSRAEKPASEPPPTSFANQPKMSPTAGWPASYPANPSTMPSWTTPPMPSTFAWRSARSMWQVEVPMTITIRPGSTTVAAGTALCASMIAAATAVPGERPSRAAIAGVRPPTRRPGGTISPWSFDASPAKRGSSAPKNAGDGKPRSRFQNPL